MSSDQPVLPAEVQAAIELMRRWLVDGVDAIDLREIARVHDLLLRESNRAEQVTRERDAAHEMERQLWFPKQLLERAEAFRKAAQYNQEAWAKEQDARLQVTRERDEARARLDGPVGDRLLLNAYGRKCYDAGQSALRSSLTQLVEWCDERRNAPDVTTLSMIQERIRGLLRSSREGEQP